MPDAPSANVRKAVIPVAGLGTRFLPVTRAVPKALLPVLSTPLIHYAVEEAAACGIETVALVMSPGMEAVSEYFQGKPGLEKALAGAAREDLFQRQRTITEMAEIVPVIQAEPRGLGHAVYSARETIGGETFALILPDDLIWNSPSALAQLLEVHRNLGGSVIAARAVPDEAVSSKGIIDAERIGELLYRVRRLVEKPPLHEAPGNLSIVGRYVLHPAVFDHLAGARTGAGGEIQITDAITASLTGAPLHALEFKGYHADAGEPAGMLLAALHAASEDERLRRAVIDAVGAWPRTQET